MDARIEPNRVTDAFPDLADYGVIGNLETVALIANTGAIELFSYPGFDSPTVFAATLDRSAGAFLVRPAFAETGKQRYLDGTNVLVTRFEADGNVVEVTDFMPVGAPSEANQIVRIVDCLAGNAQILASCRPALDYARATTTVQSENGHAVFRADGSDLALRLVADRPLALGHDSAGFSEPMAAGERMVLNLVCDSSPGDLLGDGDIDRALDRTVGFWRGWVSLSGYDGPWREAVMRSALALKLMVSNTHGSIIAAPTFGLPEAIGGERNWDYRYCWVRDSAFTIYAMLQLGFYDEAERYRCWIRDRIEERPDGSIALMYRVDGTTDDLAERHLDHLSGYRGSRPVRIGNEAVTQTQLDIYGEVIDTLYLAHGRISPISERTWTALSRLVETICDTWDTPGSGFWEMRGEPQRFLDAALMAWVGINRALRLVDKTGFAAGERWRATMDTIAGTIEQRFWNDDIGAYTQTIDGTTVDATALLMPLMKFTSADSDRFRSTVSVIEERLVDGPAVRRYEPLDIAREGVDGPPEGAFVACSFWYIECLARSRRVEEARALFDRMLERASPLGLFAEEVAADGSQLGNTPQALSHLAMISAAVAISRAERNGGEPF